MEIPGAVSWAKTPGFRSLAPGSMRNSTEENQAESKSLTDERTNIQACSRQTSKPELGLKSSEEKAKGLSENRKPETKTEIQLMLPKTKLKIDQNLSTGYRSSKKPKSWLKESKMKTEGTELSSAGNEKSNSGTINFWAGHWILLGGKMISEKQRSSGSYTGAHETRIWPWAETGTGKENHERTENDQPPTASDKK
jgi:hypothetical protein